MPGTQEVRLELLLGREVVDADGLTVGRLEEFRTERRDGEDVVIEFHVGAYAGLERLAPGQLGRSLVRLMRREGSSHGYIVPWEAMELSDPEHPRTAVPRRELKRLPA